LEFRKRLEFVQSMTLMDTKGVHTPDVFVYNGAERIIIDMPDTGSNGVYTLPFMTTLYKNVSSIQVRLYGDGAISSLTYPYCEETPKPLISIKKYAGPPNLCTASGISQMQDELYRLPNNAQWAYCYVMNVPAGSGEYLDDITLTDLASKGGIGVTNVTAVNETLCKGQTKYIAGPTKSFLDGPEGLVNATVEGYGYYSGTLASSADGAAATTLL